jgi:hypothetical protein
VKSPIKFGHFTKYHQGRAAPGNDKQLFLIAFQVKYFSGTYIDIHLDGLPE